MKLIVGLGNPGDEYKNTRHNVGFRAVDKFADLNRVDVTLPKHSALIQKINLFDEKIILVKPQTFMNLSGNSVRSLVDYYKILPSDVLVVYDDMDICVGEIKIRQKGSSGGHNGIKNIIENLNTDEFPRIKIGIGRRPNPEMSLNSFVLGKFSDDDNLKIDSAILKACQAIEDVIRYGVYSAMNNFNKKNRGE